MITLILTETEAQAVRYAVNEMVGRRMEQACDSNYEVYATKSAKEAAALHENIAAQLRQQGA